MHTTKSASVLESKQYLELGNGRRGQRPRVQKQSARILAVCPMQFREPRFIRECCWNGAHLLGHFPGRQQTWRPTKVRHTDSSTCWREARSELRDKRSAIGSATKGIARFRSVAPWNRAMPFLELVQVLVSGQKRKRAGTPACHSFRKIGRLTLSLFLNPFENIVVPNRAVRKEAVHRILLHCENFENRVRLSEDHQAQMKWETRQFQHPVGPSQSVRDRRPRRLFRHRHSPSRPRS
jgi:hypothetical protein